MNHAPSPNGRDPSGRFVQGWQGGPGNPYAHQVSRLRAAMLAAVSEHDMIAIIARLVQLAKDGDVRAIKELLDRTLGRPVEADLLERLSALEARAAQSGLSR